MSCMIAYWKGPATLNGRGPKLVSLVFALLFHINTAAEKKKSVAKVKTKIDIMD